MNALVMRPMDWAPLKDIEDVAPLGEADAACMHDLFAVLKRHGKIDRFGVTLLHKHFPMAEDEVLLERTYSADRRLVLEPAKVGSDDIERSVQTSWALSEEGGQLVRGCYRRCFKNVQGGHSDGGHYNA
jgi:hypothetical protein